MVADDDHGELLMLVEVLRAADRVDYWVREFGCVLALDGASFAELAPLRSPLLL